MHNTGRERRPGTEEKLLILLDTLITIFIEDLNQPKAAGALLEIARVSMTNADDKDPPPYTRDPQLARAYLRLRRIVRELSRPVTTPFPWESGGYSRYNRRPGSHGRISPRRRRKVH